MTQQEASAASYEFYSAQYARFQSEIASEIRREVYGEDLGQQGWRTLDEQAEIGRLVGEHSPCSALDIGCGSGGPSVAAAAVTGCRLTGVDIEPAAIMEAKRRAVAAGVSDTVDFIVADCNQPLPFDAESFDVVISIDSVAHLADRFAALNDWSRLLKPGGGLLLTDAAVLTGAMTKEEVAARGSQGPFVFVPSGVNETAIARAGFRLRERKDTTPAVAAVAQRTLDARRARAPALQEAESAEWFDRRQAFLATTAQLAASGRLSRFNYIAEKPARLAD